MPVVITGNNTPTAGGVTYGDGSTYANTAAGTAGQLLQSNGASAPTWATVSAGFTLGTPVATTSGTSIDFTGIPAGTKQIVITFKNVSTSGTSSKLIQIGDSGGIETTSYSSRSTSIISTTLGGTGVTSGFIIYSILASTALSGSITLTLENATTFSWVGIGTVGDAEESATFLTVGNKSLSATLDRVRITTVNGTDTFDAGEINIAYI
jgi:hypothetical protein